MLENAWQTDVSVVLRIERILNKESSCDGINENRRGLIELQIARHAGLGNSIRGVKVDVTHTCHFDVQFLRQ